MQVENCLLSVRGAGSGKIAKHQTVGDGRCVVVEGGSQPT